MGGAAEHRADGALLDQFAAVHDADAVADLRDGPEIVADEEDGGAVALAQRADEVEDGGLDGHVESGGGFVHDQERGAGDEGHGDDDALLLAAGELVRVAVEQGGGVWQLDLGHGGQREVAGLAGADRTVQGGDFRQLAADGHHRVEAAHRVLVDHGDLASADGAERGVVEAGHVAALEQDAPGDEAAGAAEIAHDGEGDGGLAGAGFADEAERLALVDGEAEAGDDVGFAGAQEEGDAGGVQFEDGRISGDGRVGEEGGFSHAGPISRRPTASRLKPMVREEMAAQGKRAMWGQTDIRP